MLMRLSSSKTFQDIVRVNLNTYVFRKRGVEQSKVFQYETCNARLNRIASRVFEFTPRDYARVRSLIYKQAGISLSESKQEMVYSRLSRRLRAKNLNSFEAYLDRPGKRFG